MFSGKLGFKERELYLHSHTLRGNIWSLFTDLIPNKKNWNSSLKTSMISVINSLIFVRTRQLRMNYIRELILFLMNFGKLLRIERNSILKKERRLWKVDGLNMSLISW